MYAVRMNVFTAVFVTLYVAVLSASAAIYDEDLSSATESHLGRDNLFLSFRGINPPRRPSRTTQQALLSFAFPSHNRLGLTLDRTNKQLVIQTTLDGEIDRKKLEIKELSPLSKLDLLIDVSQKDKTATVYANCRLVGTIHLSTAPREMVEPPYKLRVYRGRNSDVSIDWETNLLDLLAKFGCRNDVKNDNIQAQSNDIYTYRRGDIPVIPEEQKASALVQTLEALIETIRELQDEIQTQREETALLRDALINCEICKPGRANRY